MVYMAYSITKTKKSAKIYDIRHFCKHTQNPSNQCYWLEYKVSFPANF